MNQPRISIAMTTYNAGPWLEAQLASFVDQDLLPDELVVCDDRSNDQSVDTIIRQSTADERLEI